MRNIFAPDGTSLRLTNPIVALKVSQRLNKVNKHLTYKVYKLSKDEERRIDDSLIVSTYEEYETLKEKQWADSIKKLEDLKAKQSREMQDSIKDEKTL